MMIWAVAAFDVLAMAFFGTMAASSQTRSLFCGWIDNREEKNHGR